MDFPFTKTPDGKYQFIGKDDPTNPPVIPRNPLTRYCTFCKKEFGNENACCPKCSRQFDDGKMECPICHKWFNTLLGEDVGGGRMGCEADWKPPTERVIHGNEKPIGKIFD